MQNWKDKRHLLKKAKCTYIRNNTGARAKVLKLGDYLHTDRTLHSTKVFVVFKYKASQFGILY